MTSIFDKDESPQSIKMLSVGKSGTSKTGAEVALVCGGYKLRKLDIDNKAKPLLLGLLTNPEYPYGEICRKRGIDLESAIDIQSIPLKMKFDTVMHRVSQGPNRPPKETPVNIGKPVNVDGWGRIHNLLDDWPKLGSIDEWDDDVVLSVDSGSTMGQLAYYFSQYLNGRLGDLEDGYDHQRDIGGAQTYVRRYLEKLTAGGWRCHINLITHVTWADMKKGYARSPGEMARTNKEEVPDLEGYPSIIGVALSPRVGIRFNDMFVYKREGGGMSTRRFISTRPTDNIDVKSSTWLKPEYPIESGLYEIMEALRGREPDGDLIKELRGSNGAISTPPPGLNLPR